MAFLDLLLEYSEDNPDFTDEDVQHEVDTFMLGGHDTTAAALNWFFYMMGHCPDIQVCLYVVSSMR